MAGEGGPVAEVRPASAQVVGVAGLDVLAAELGRRVYFTSNKAFSEWGHVFAGDPVMAADALDRLLHRSTVVDIIK